MGQGLIFEAHVEASRDSVLLFREREGISVSGACNLRLRRSERTIGLESDFFFLGILSIRLFYCIDVYFSQ